MNTERRNSEQKRMPGTGETDRPDTKQYEPSNDGAGFGAESLPRHPSASSAKRTVAGSSQLRSIISFQNERRRNLRLMRPICKGCASRVTAGRRRGKRGLGEP